MREEEEEEEEEEGGGCREEGAGRRERREEGGGSREEGAEYPSPKLNFRSALNQISSQGRRRDHVQHRSAGARRHLMNQRRAG